MAEKYLDDTPYDENLFGGKVITAREGFLVGKDNYRALYNMRYSKGVGIETRYGMRRFNNTAIGSGADIEKIWQHLYTFEQTRQQDLYVVTDEPKLYKADSIPEASAGAGSLGSSLFDFSAGSGFPSFAAVNNHAIGCAQKDLIGYSGATPYVATFLYGIDIGTADTAADEDDKTFQIATDEVTRPDTSETVAITLDTQANNEGLYVGFWQPIDGINFVLGNNLNNNTATLTIEYWDGSAWVVLSTATVYSSGGETATWDGTSLAGWTAADAGAGVSDTDNFLTFPCWSFDSDPADTPASPDVAIRYNSANNLGNRVVISFDLYVDETGTGHTGGGMRFSVNSTDGTRRLEVDFSTQGIRVYDGASYIEVGTDEVILDTWQTWTFDADFTTELCQVYLDDAQIGTDVDISYTVALSADEIQFANYGYTTNSEMYIKDLKLGTTLIIPFNLVDGTASGGAPFAQSGSITWDYPAVGSEDPRRINGLTLFWYRILTSAVLDPVEFVKMTVSKDWREVEDLTDGRDMFTSGFLWMDDGDDAMTDLLDRVLVDSKGLYASFTDATVDEDIAAADEIYIGFPSRILAFRIWMVEKYNNTGNASALTVSYWNGTAWVAYAADEFNDGTSSNSKSLNQTGEIRLEDKEDAVKPSTIVGAGIKLPMYWYKLEWDNKMYNDVNDEMRIWKVRGIPAPRTVVEVGKFQWISNFKQRLFLFGPEDGPNLAEFSAFLMPYALSGDDTSTTWPRIVFGNQDEIQCAVNYFNEMIVFKRTEVWMMEGDSPDTFGTLLLDDTIGCVAPETAKLVRTWVSLPDGRQDFRHAIFFMSHDGIWAVDGVKVWKVSEDIDNYFNPVDTDTVIKTGYREQSTAFFEPIENEYHVFLWSGPVPTLLEFIYDTLHQKWCGPFVRGVGCIIGETCLDINDDRVSYGGGDDGRIYRLEIGTNDVNDSNETLAIQNYVEMGDAWEGLLSKYAHRGVFLFGKAQTAGDVTVEFIGDGSSTPITIGTISMIRSGFSTFIDRVVIGDRDASGAQMENKFHAARLRFSTNAVDIRQELFGFLVKKKDVSEAALP